MVKMKTGKVLIIIGAILLILLIVTQFATIVSSSIRGDVYLFPAGLLAKISLEGEEEFKNYIEDKGYEIIKLGWFTATRDGKIWTFYLEVQDKEIPESMSKEDIILNYWSYHTNGYVYYNQKTNEIRFSIV